MEKRWLLVGLVVTLLGCGGGGETPAVDAATPPDDTGVTPDAYVVPTPVVELEGGGAPDYSCIGTATAPTAGADVSVSLHGNAFFTNMAIANQTVELWTTNVIGTGACAAPDCFTVTTDASGDVDATLPGGGWYAYHLPASAMTAQVLAYNRPAPTVAGEMDDVTGFAASTVSLVSMLLGRSFSDAAGAASGTVTDCQGRGVGNAQIRIFSGDTEVISGAPADRSTPRITGLEGTSPTGNGLTGSDGTFVGANVPPGDYRVEVYGVREDGGESELLGCEEGRLVGGGITVFTVGGLRSDYPEGSGCAR